jgi:hypothetical protein
MRNPFNQPGRRLWIALFALVLFSFLFTLIALLRQAAPPVVSFTVKHTNASVVRGKPIKANAAMEGNLEKARAPETILLWGGESQAEVARGTNETEMIHQLKKLWKNADEYYGRTITVDGEMHRQFNDRVFTIEDSGFLDDRDMLVISLVPMSDSAIPLQESFEKGKNVRVTGTVRPYDRARLECLFGPLNLEFDEGHSFTKNPVLIIGYRERGM